MGVALAVAVARVLMQMFWTESLRYFYEHPWQKLGLDTAEMVLWATAVVLMTGAIGRRYDAGGLGSFARAAEGLARYRTAISLRIILAVSVIALSFMAVSARSMGLLQLVLSGSVVVGVGIAVHAARGLAGFARQPIVTGGAHWAIAAAILSLLAVLFSGVGLLDLPDFFKGGSRFRDAAEGLQALSNFGNTVGFAGVFFILLSIVKVAGHLEERLLAARARSLMWLIGLAAGSVIFLQQFGGLGLIKSAGALIGIGLVVLVVAIVALVRYLGLLGDLVTKLEIDHGVEPPRATATMLDD
ncbi:MAG: hypothetical protein KJO07_24715, partial [Deltaproteobacteria bacterium]|nr:hypothetical protein [Deltaproteobacteria bacterium]